MPQQRKQASSGAKKASSGAKKATSGAKTAASGAASKTASTGQKAASTTKQTTGAAKRTSSAAQSQPKAIAEMTKPELVERLSAQLNKLKKDDLVGMVERAESGSLDFSHFTVRGAGGFGFQEHVREGSAGES